MIETVRLAGLFASHAMLRVVTGTTLRLLYSCLVCLGAFLLLGCSQRPADDPARSDEPSFFRVEQREGTWTFVDPRGRSFFSLGINVIVPTEDEKVKGLKYNGLSRHGGSREKWQAFTLQRLQTWNFNTIGAWSSLRGQPYVLELDLTYSWMDVFENSFEEQVRQAAQTVLKRPDVASDYATLDRDPLLLGYFTDNELAWGWGHGWTGKKGDLSLFEYYATLERDTPGKKAWAAYLTGVYRGDFQRLRRVWKVEADSEEDLLSVEMIVPRGTEHYEEAGRVADRFLARVAQRYFEVTNGVMRGHLPHHLNLGTRLTPHFPAVVAELAGHYVDVLSYNVYQRDVTSVRDEVTRLYQAGKKPVLVSEFSFPARHNRSGNRNKGYEQAEVRDDAERGEHYDRWVSALAALPFVVGCHWFQYFDEPSKGRADGESCNFGFVDLQDREYEDLVRRATEANARVLTNRAAKPSPVLDRPSGARRGCSPCRHRGRRGRVLGAAAAAGDRVEGD